MVPDRDGEPIYMTKLPTNSRYQITDKDFFKEIQEIIANIEILLDQIINHKKNSLVKTLSVELRKLLNPTERGGSVLERAQKTFGITLEFTVNTPPPPNTKLVGLDNYIHGLAFFLAPRRWSRIDIIKVVADEKGAHTDPTSDIIHTQSKNIILPIGNPARDRFFFEQNYTYIISIGVTILKVVRNQITIPLSNKF